MPINNQYRERKVKMIKNTYDITVKGKTLRDFEFIVGPMAAISVPLPPRQPEEFVLGSFNGGATPIVAPRDVEVDTYIEDIRKIKGKMEDRYFGVNVLGLWQIAPDFIKEFNKLGDDSPDFLDVNAVELKFDTILPLLKDVKVPITMGISQPLSVYAFKKLLLKKEYSFLIDRFKAGTLKLFLPRNRGGGHLPILMKKHDKLNWLDDLIQEAMSLEKAINTPVPFVVEKDMMTVDDFVNTIVKYSRYPSFSGIRFASNLELTKESGLSSAAKELLTTIVREQKRDMIIPIHSIIGNSRFKKGMQVKGGVFIHVVATRIARMIYGIQCDGKDSPQFSRTYNPAVLVYQASKSERRACHLCFDGCSQEYCEAKGSYDSVCPDSDVDDALIIVSPRIFEIDQRYIDASVDFVVRDLIEQTLLRIRHEHSEKPRVDKKQSIKADLGSF